MSTITLYDLGMGGINKDIPPHLLPPELWSNGINARFKDGYVQRHPGHASVFVPGLVPGFIFNVAGPTDSFWLYASLTAIRGYSGGTDTDVTRLSGPYNAINLRDWTGCMLGGIPILNNAVDVPQYWPTLALGTRLADLTAWPANLRAKFVRNFGLFLVAGNLVEAGSVLAHAVRWSHPADPGSVPPSWDVTDPTRDAGQTHLTDIQGGVLQDAQLLGNQLILYKQRSTHAMRFVGGNNIFGFDLLFNQGVYCPRSACVIDAGLKHFVVGADDIYIHQGTKQVEYPLDKKNRRSLYNEIDEEHGQNSFAFDNPLFEEVWFCYPTSGATYPNKALIYNYRTGAIGYREFDGLSVDVGDFAEAGVTWDSLTNSWDAATKVWDNKSARRLLVASPLNTKIWSMDTGFVYGDATNKLWNLQRTGLGIGGKGRDGAPKADYTTQKLFKRIWTKYRGSGTLQMRLGAQDEIDGTVFWADYQDFDPAIRYNDFEVNGRLGAVEYRSISDANGKLEGYDLEYEILGEL